MKNQRGFTLYELIAALGFIFWLCAVGAILYVVAHFISKFW